MKYVFKILSILFLILFVVSCQSVARFASSKNANKATQEQTSTKSNTSNNTTKTKFKSSYNSLNEKQRAVLSEADKWIGTRYCYGGEDANCVDCSGFVQNVFMRVGVNLPRTAQLQYNYTLRIRKNELAPADLIFFKRSGSVNHVGIYIGNSEFIHASTSQGVIRDNLERYSTFHTIAGYGRALR